MARHMAGPTGLTTGPECIGAAKKTSGLTRLGFGLLYFGQKNGVQVLHNLTVHKHKRKCVRHTLDKQRLVRQCRETLALGDTSIFCRDKCVQGL